MKMTPNKTWINYLTLWAFSLLFCLLAGSCSKDGKGRNGKFYYVNETDHSITVSFRSEVMLSLMPRETVLIEQNQPTDRTEKKVLAEDYVNPLTFNDLTIRFDNKCLTSTSNSTNSIINISSYKAEKIENAKYKFTYTFSEADYNRAITCM